VSESPRIRIRRIIEALRRGCLSLRGSYLRQYQTHRFITENMLLHFNSYNRCNRTILCSTFVSISHILRNSSARRSLPMIAIFPYAIARSSLWRNQTINRNDSLIMIGPCRTRALARYCHICRHAPELANKRWTYRTGGNCYLWLMKT